MWQLISWVTSRKQLPKEGRDFNCLHSYSGQVRLRPLISQEACSQYCGWMHFFPSLPPAFLLCLLLTHATRHYLLMVTCLKKQSSLSLASPKSSFQHLQLTLHLILGRALALLALATVKAPKSFFGPSRRP